MVPEVIANDSDQEAIRSMGTRIPNLNQSCSSCRRHSSGGEIKDKKIVRRIRSCRSMEISEDQFSDGPFDENDSGLTSVKPKLSGKAKLV